MASNDKQPWDRWSHTVMFWTIVASLGFIVSVHWLVNWVTSAGIDNPDPKAAIAELLFRIRVMVSLSTAVATLAVVVVVALCAREGLLILRTRSYPPPGVRVHLQIWSGTGRSAALVGVVHMVATALLLLVAARGFWFLVRWPE